MKEKLIELKGEIEKSVILGDFSTSHQLIELLERKSSNQQDLIGISRTPSNSRIHIVFKQV